MSNVASEREALGYLIVALLLGRGDDGGGDFGIGEVLVVELKLVGYYA